MSSIRRLNRSGVSSNHGSPGSLSGDGAQLHLYPSEESENAVPLHPSSTQSTRVSTGFGPSPQMREEDSIVSVATSRETQEHKQPPPIDGNASHDPAIPPPDMTEAGTNVEDGQRTDKRSRSGSNVSEAPPQVGEPSPFPRYTGSSSPGSSMLLQVGSLHGQPPTHAAPFDDLDDDDHQSNHFRESQENTSGHDRERRHRPTSLG
ncbi:hypothetical protein CLAIMM_13878 isoform 2 [Cladophialophora immunda]|nr:hypothetical protein CLAIMM_13878 isoform 2 [Cladophialophora immunda]